VVKRQGVGRPKRRPGRLVGDKSYSRRAIRRYLRGQGIRITMPRKCCDRRTGPCDRSMYRQRNKIERLINRLKQFRRIATRDEQRAANDQAMLCLAAMVLWL
jgi:transposase